MIYIDNKYSTGNYTCDQIGKMNLSGDVIPRTWFKTIVKENGKPYLLAMHILAEVIYWYRPVEERDERSGEVIGYRKKFKADKLQKSYNDLAELFGESKRSIERAVCFLVECDLLVKECRTIEAGDKKIGNVLFLDINPAALFKVTYLDNSKDETPYTKNVIRGYDKNGISPYDKNGRTYTKNTNTKITYTSSSDKLMNEDDDLKNFVDYKRAYNDYPTIAKSLLKACRQRGKIDAESFYSICKSVSENNKGIMNLDRYMIKCLEQKRNAPKAQKKRNFNSGLSRDIDMDEYEKNILAN